METPSCHARHIPGDATRDPPAPSPLFDNLTTTTTLFINISTGSSATRLHLDLLSMRCHSDTAQLGDCGRLTS